MADSPDLLPPCAAIVAFAVEAAILDDSQGVSEAERARAGSTVGLRALLDAGMVAFTDPATWPDGMEVPNAATVRAEFRHQEPPVPDWATAVPPQRKG